MHGTNKKLIVSVAAAAAQLTASRSAFGALVANGDFEVNGGLGQIGAITTLANWNVGPAQNGGNPAFAFVVDANADSTGFPSQFSPPNIKIWGPGSGVNNGFTGSPTGGKFLGVDADYKTASVSQTISGLTPGNSYTLSFDWAGSQFTDQSGPTTQWWQVGFGSSTQDTTHTAVASQGFTGWMHSVLTFTADSTSDTLSFQAKALPFTSGAPAGLPPFVLLDGVTLDPSPVPEPSTIVAGASTLLLVGAGALRRKQQKA
jgi:hypothetical protein